MAKHFKVILVAVLLAICTAEPIQFRGNPRKNRFFARQEVAPSSPAPSAYPPAGVTPEIAFELPTEVTTVQPDNTYLPPAPAPTPDNTYGPPEPEQTYGPPDNQYGPPAEDDASAVASALPAEDPQAERIILVQRYQKPSARLRKIPLRSQPLRLSKLQLEPIEIVRSQPVLSYSVQYKSI